MVSTSFKFAVNTSGVNKDWDYRKLASDFQDRTGTVADVVDHVSAGHAICAGLLNNRWRKKANFAGSYWILLDIDNSTGATDADGNPVDADGCPIKLNGRFVDADGNIIEASDGRKQAQLYRHDLTLDEALENPFIKRHCALIYTTASHGKPDTTAPNSTWDKFRLVFLLPEFVEDIETYEAMVRLLMGHLPHDPSCKDGVRVFYGNNKAEFPLIKAAAVLPAGWAEQARAEAQRAKLEQEQRLAAAQARREAFTAVAQAEGWDADQLIQKALTYIPPRSPGSGNYDECRQVLMALVNYYGPADAEIIAEQWSPSIKGTTWNIRQKIKSFRRSGVTIGTLFHIAKQYGFKFPVLQQTHGQWCDRTIGREQWEQIKREQTQFEVIELLNRQLAELSCAPEIAGSLPIVEPVTDNIHYVENQRDGYLQGIKAGVTLIVNRSVTGIGKDWFQGHAKPEFFNCDRTIRVISNLLNYDRQNYPESDWSTLEGRHHGTVTQDGTIKRARIDTDDWSKLTPANCHKADAIQVGRSQNMASAAYETACKTCIFNHKCGKESGNGYGARYQAAQTWENNQVLTSYGRLQGIAAGNEKANLVGAHLSLDEASNAFEITKSLEVLGKDVDRTIADLSLDKDSSLHADLLPFFSWIKSDAYRDIPGFHHCYGMEQARFETHLADLLDGVDMDALIDAIAEFEDGAEELDTFGLGDTAGVMSKKERSRRSRLTAKKVMAPGTEYRWNELRLEKNCRRLNAQEKREVSLIRKYYLVDDEEKELAELDTKFEQVRHQNLTPGETLEKMKSLRKRWLSEFFGVLTGRLRGHIHMNSHGGFTIHIYNADAIAAIQTAKLVTVTDASEVSDPALLSQKYSIPEDQIFIFEVGKPAFSNVNVTVTQVTGLGAMGRNRGKGLEDCKTCLVDALKAKNPTHQHFDHEQYSHDGRLFRDTIGSNDYKDCTSLSAAPPRPSITGLLAQYCAIHKLQVTKDDAGFQEHYNTIYREQIRQAIGRLRANMKPDSHHDFYLLTDQGLPYPVDAIIRASDVTRTAARKGERTILALMDAARELIDQGQHFTQTALAIATRLTGLNNGKGFTQQYISKLWGEVLNRLQLFLYSPNKKSCRNLELLVIKAQVLEEVAKQPDPQVLIGGIIECCLDMIQADEFAAVLNHVSDYARHRILTVMLALLPEKMRSRLPDPGGLPPDDDLIWI